MINGHDDHVATACEIRSVVIGRRSRTGGEASSMAPEHHRAFRAAIATRAHGGCPNVEHQAIFALGWQVLARDTESACLTGRSGRITLRSAVSVFKSIAYAGPFSRFHGRYKAGGSRRTCSVRDAFE